MNMKQIGAISYPAGYEVKKQEKISFVKCYPEKKQDKHISAKDKASSRVSVMDIYNMMKQAKKDISEAKNESETKTEIIVKPDGSRALVVTMSIGGMETTMSLEISKPTDIPNESKEKYNEDLGDSEIQKNPIAKLPVKS